MRDPHPGRPAMTDKTVLNATHRELGARMVDFGGWDMPISYGSQIEEHHAVRRDAGRCHAGRIGEAKCRRYAHEPESQKPASNS